MNPQRALIERARSLLAEDDRIIAAWVGGSFATGVADDYSDVDLHIVVREDAIEYMVEEWPALVERLMPVVLAMPLPGMIGGFTLSPDYLHIDLIVHPRGSFTLDMAEPCLPLFDKEGSLLPESAGPAGLATGEPFFPRHVADLFFYYLGNIVVSTGRDELVLAMNGAIALRDACLAQLMLAERGVRRTSGAKRLRPLLDAEQYAALTALPPLEPTRSAVIAFCSRVAAEFVRRGRRLAERTGSEWPFDLERAASRHCERHLGITLGDGHGGP